MRNRDLSGEREATSNELYARRAQDDKAIVVIEIETRRFSVRVCPRRERSCSRDRLSIRYRESRIHY